MFKNVKKGDRVWDFRKGWGTVTSINCGDVYKIQVKFDISDTHTTYTTDGKYYSDDMGPSLFWDKVLITAPEIPMKVDTKLLVWNGNDYGQSKEKRYFSHFINGRVQTFCSGADSWSGGDDTVQWDHWKLAV